MAYKVERKICSKNGWFTPAEAKNYYGRYNRTGVTVHWWGDGTGASNHNNIVNYIAGKAKAGTGSVNYVVSDKKITMMVEPNNVAWASQGGNPISVSIEFQPTLHAEGYKRGGWLIAQLEKKYKRKLRLYKHSHWVATACPGTISLSRLRAEANKAKAKPKPKKPTYVIVKKNWGLALTAKAGKFKDWFSPLRWAAITKLNVGHYNWRKFNASLKPGQKVRVRK